jgi:hypothetical protein
MEANNVLSNHRFDNAGKQQHHKPNQNSEKTTNNNKLLYTDRQVQRAKLARNMVHHR